MHRAEEIRFVTSQFEGLQGLRGIPIGVAIIVWAIMAPPNRPGNTLLEAGLLVAAFGVGIIGDRLIGAWYQRQMGTVQRATIPRNYGRNVALGTCFVLMMQLNKQGILPFDLWGIFWAATLYWPARTGAWQRPHYAVGAAAVLALTFAPLNGSLPRFSCIGCPQTQTLALVIGAVIIACSVLDHQYLMHTLDTVRDDTAYAETL